MDEQHKRTYLEKYQIAKKKGVRFWPDIILKDVVVMLGIFVLLVVLATFVGVAQEPKADPSDTTYVPRPEWYFMFLFQMLEMIPGQVAWLGAAVIPGLAVLAMFLLPFFDRNPYRHWKKRIFAIVFMTLTMIGIVALSIIAVIKTPKMPEVAMASSLREKVTLGQDLYSLNCVECHGPDGEGGEVKGVEGMEGRVLAPINSQDILYTRTDDTLFNVIQYGQPILGMPGFGKAYGGELSLGEIESIVAFMRYTWDDRMELPADTDQAASALAQLGPNDIPNYEDHISVIVQRYCISCHRPGKKNNNYVMGSYEEVMSSGDHQPNIIPFDLNGNLIQMINRKEIEAGGVMPPTKALPPELIAIFERWVKAGVPKTAADAAGAPTPAAVEITPTITATLGVTTTLVVTPTAMPTPTGPAQPTPTPTPGLSTLTPTLPVMPPTLTPTPTPTPMAPVETQTPTLTPTPYPPPP